jgi:soluble lytic murein transglycosylase-like protein
MGKYTKYDIKVPDINRSYVLGGENYAKPSTIAQNIDMLKTIKNTYSKFVNKWGIEFEIDDSIIHCFIATESGGVNRPPNTYSATGLMQMTPVAVWETIAKWTTMVDSPLSVTAKNYFSKVLPYTKNLNANSTPIKKSDTNFNKTLDALRKDQEFNIAIGIAHIRGLYEAFAKNEKISMNKVMVSYNAGYYSTRNLVKGNKTTQQLVDDKRIPFESRKYLLKMLGINGFLDLWFKNNL